MLKVAQRQHLNSGISTTTTETLDDYDLGGVDCEICGNKGYVLNTGSNGELLTRECECMAKRRSMRRIRKSGISDMLERYTFKNYADEDDVRHNVKQTAIRFANADSGWFYIAGQPGSGKTQTGNQVDYRNQESYDTGNRNGSGKESTESRQEA